MLSGFRYPIYLLIVLLAVPVYYPILRKKRLTVWTMSPVPRFYLLSVLRVLGWAMTVVILPLLVAIPLLFTMFYYLAIRPTSLY